MSEIQDRTPRQQYCVKRIHDCGPRMEFEVMWQLSQGKPFDDTLEFFAQLDPADCRAAGISDLPKLKVVNGGRP
jgi:hypothetical protein